VFDKTYFEGILNQSIDLFKKACISGFSVQFIDILEEKNA
jgi:hypothetical protein